VLLALCSRTPFALQFRIARPWRKLPLLPNAKVRPLAPAPADEPRSSTVGAPEEHAEIVTVSVIAGRAESGVMRVMAEAKVIVALGATALASWIAARKVH
jgi:hypothetical protein